MSRVDLDARSPLARVIGGAMNVRSLILLAIVAAGGYYFYSSNEEPVVPADPGAVTGREIRAQPASSQHATLSALLEQHATPSHEHPAFIRCIGDFAATKNPDLTLARFYDWCLTEKENNPSSFNSHFDELSAKDLSIEAGIICQNFIQPRLSNPASADFPLLDRTVWRHREQAYSVRSYVDAQNAFGATIRNNFLCKLQYAGTGDALDPRNWRLLTLDLTPG